jgi:guanosine-3',5'-bis(diphosphate) 3'-pyrophosphohydrolase
MDDPAARYRPLLEAVSFAARAHDGQLRKDGRTPYVSHVFRVCLVVRHVFGIDDPQMMMAALLHDTIEDTRTDLDDLLELLGGSADPVAGWVAALTKDKRLPEPEREATYLDGLSRAPRPVRLCKLADLFDNLLDSAHLRDEQWGRTRCKARETLTALHPDSVPDDDAAYRKAHETVGTLLARLERQRGI